MRNSFRNSIRFKLLCITLTIILFSLLVLCYVSYRFVYSANSSSYYEAGTMLLSQAQKRVEELMLSAQSTIDAIQVNTQIQEALQHSGSPDYSLSDQLDDMRNLKNEFISYELAGYISGIRFVYENNENLASKSKPITLDRDIFLSMTSDQRARLSGTQKLNYIWLTDDLSSLGIKDGSEYIAISGTVRNFKYYEQILGYTIVLQRKDLYVDFLADSISSESRAMFILVDSQNHPICVYGNLPEYQDLEKYPGLNAYAPGNDVLQLSVPVSANGWKLIMLLSMDEFQTGIRHYLVFIISIAAIIALVAVAASIIINNHLIIRRVAKIVNTMDSIGQSEDMESRISITGHDEISLIEQHFNGMIDKLSESRKTEHQMIENDKINQMKLIHAQINPHFLYNTLNTIYWSAQDKDFKSVQTMIKSLSNFYKTGFQPYSDTSTLANEILHVQEYIALINISKKLSIHLDVDIPDELRDLSVPHFLLQPIIENCVIHGFRQQEDGTISLHMEKNDVSYKLTIKDNGLGLPDSIRPSDESGSHYGLKNIQRHLSLYYNGQAGLSIQNIAPQGCLVTITIPLNDIIEH